MCCSIAITSIRIVWATFEALPIVVKRYAGIILLPPAAMACSTTIAAVRLAIAILACFPIMVALVSALAAFIPILALVLLRKGSPPGKHRTEKAMQNNAEKAWGDTTSSAPLWATGALQLLTAYRNLHLPALSDLVALIAITLGARVPCAWFVDVVSRGVLNIFNALPTFGDLSHGMMVFSAVVVYLTFFMLLFIMEINMIVEVVVYRRRCGEVVAERVWPLLLLTAYRNLRLPSPHPHDVRKRLTLVITHIWHRWRCITLCVLAGAGASILHGAQKAEKSWHQFMGGASRRCYILGQPCSTTMLSAGCLAALTLRLMSLGVHIFIYTLAGFGLFLVGESAQMPVMIRTTVAKTLQL